MIYIISYIRTHFFIEPHSILHYATHNSNYIHEKTLANNKRQKPHPTISQKCTEDIQHSTHIHTRASLSSNISTQETINSWQANSFFNMFYTQSSNQEPLSELSLMYKTTTHSTLYVYIAIHRSVYAGRSCSDCW